MTDFNPKRRDRVVLTNKNVKNVFSVEDPKAIPSKSARTFAELKENVKINIIEEKDSVVVFEIVGIHAPLANALRRIMISEVPTMAIENVNIYQNTSIMQDEVLAHRLGLIPLQADARQFKFVRETKNSEMNETNTIVFTLVAKCTRNPKANNKSPPDKQYLNSEVHSGDLKWIPQGDQEKKFSNGIRPVHDDIIISHLRPGQIIEAELLAEKGIGADHAKWSPVCTATYRLLPEIKFVKGKEPKGKDAKTLVKRCPMKVFDIEDIGSEKVARVRYPRNCSMCRECIRHEGWEDRIQLQRVRDHFIFSVESTGAYKAKDIVIEALRILKKKSTSVLSEVESMYDRKDK
mmetsp:Transcript_17733/g.26562  ORF Transcript_17733/g.26562 Transcript_17733/m.26562 type:complete len:348 (+) Transcript_17733:3-1046(+)